MVRWRLKGCPRCGGDVFIEKDLDNWYEQCLQCSYRVELKTLGGFEETVQAGEKRSKRHDGTEERS
jgi:ribosomal protein S27AE